MSREEKVHEALWLIDNGVDVSSAASRSGYASVDSLRKAIYKLGLHRPDVERESQLVRYTSSLEKALADFDMARIGGTNRVYCRECGAVFDTSPSRFREYSAEHYEYCTN